MCIHWHIPYVSWSLACKSQIILTHTAVSMILGTRVHSFHSNYLSEIIRLDVMPTVVIFIGSTHQQTITSKQRKKEKRRKQSQTNRSLNKFLLDLRNKRVWCFQLSTFSATLAWANERQIYRKSAIRSQTLEAWLVFFFFFAEDWRMVFIMFLKGKNAHVRVCAVVFDDDQRAIVPTKQTRKIYAIRVNWNPNRFVCLAFCFAKNVHYI